MQQATESAAWIRRSVAAVRPMMSNNAAVAHMERCAECIGEVARGSEGLWPHIVSCRNQVLENVLSMRDPFYLSLQTGELRGITQVKCCKMQASRIIELHAAMKNIIAMEETEIQYGRGGRQSRLDAALAERGMRRAPEAPYIAGDCVFDSISYRLQMIGSQREFGRGPCASYSMTM